MGDGVELVIRRTRPWFMGICMGYGESCCSCCWSGEERALGGDGKKTASFAFACAEPWN